MEDKNLDTLVDDILEMLNSKTSTDISDEDLTELSVGIAFQVTKALQEHVKVREEKVLYASEVGEPCLRKLWYKLHHPQKGEYLTRETRLKFLYGDILEELLLYMAHAAGHKVEQQQASVVFEFEDGWQIRGRIDAVIDGEIVDVKTASPYSYKKMVDDGLTKENDAFGYSGQIQFYQMNKDQLGVEGMEPRFLVMDKQNGKVGLAKAAPHSELTVEKLEAIKDEVKDPGIAPERGFSDQSTTNGNRKLGVNCSYCAFKGSCWPGLRVFQYARGPEWLTEVKKVPKNAEITAHWKATAFKKEEE